MQIRRTSMSRGVSDGFLPKRVPDRLLVNVDEEDGESAPAPFPPIRVRVASGPHKGAEAEIVDRSADIAADPTADIILGADPTAIGRVRVSRDDETGPARVLISVVDGRAKLNGRSLPEGAERRTGLPAKLTIGDNVLELSLVEVEGQRVGRRRGSSLATPLVLGVIGLAALFVPWPDRLFDTSGWGAWRFDAESGRGVLTEAERAPAAPEGTSPMVAPSAPDTGVASVPVSVPAPVEAASASPPEPVVEPVAAPGAAPEPAEGPAEIAAADPEAAAAPTPGALSEGAPEQDDAAADTTAVADLEPTEEPVDGAPEAEASVAVDADPAPASDPTPSPAPRGGVTPAPPVVSAPPVEPQPELASAPVASPEPRPEPEPEPEPEPFAATVAEAAPAATGPVSVSDARAMLEQALRDAGLASDVQLTNRNGVIVARGMLSQNAHDTWRDLKATYESRADAAPFLDLVGVLFASAPPRNLISAVLFGERPQVIARDGARAGVGQPLREGWVVQSIDPAAVVLARGRQQVRIELPQDPAETPSTPGG